MAIGANFSMGPITPGAVLTGSIGDVLSSSGSLEGFFGAITACQY